MTAENSDALIDNACKVSEDFINLFYEALDQKRHTLSRFYMDNATLAWDGTSARGKEEIQKFYESLCNTDHTLQALDAQPVAIQAVKGQQTVLIHAAGRLTAGKPSKNFAFTNSFVITAQDNKWRIFSHTCRLQRVIKPE